MLNVIALMGRLVADPELRKTPNAISTTTFTIACERSFVKAGGERQTDFFDIVAWRSSAEFACKYFRKGQLVAVNGTLQSRSYEDKQGVKRKVYEVIADNLHFAESRSGGSQGEFQRAATSDFAEEPASYSAGEPDNFALIDDNPDLPF